MNVFNCKKLWIARRKHQHLQTAGKDNQLGKRDGVRQKGKSEKEGGSMCTVFSEKEDNTILDVDNFESAGEMCCQVS